MAPRGLAAIQPPFEWDEQRGLPAIAIPPELLPQAIRGALSETLLRRPGDDPMAELSQQRFAKADPLAFAMGIMGGPRLMGAGGKWHPLLDDAEIFKQLALERRNAGGSTVRVFKDQNALDASRRPLTETEIAGEKAKYGWRGDTDRALDDFRAATAEYRPRNAPVEPDPFGPRPNNWPQVPGETLNIPPKDITAKQQMSLADLLSKFGLGALALPPAYTFANQDNR